MILLTPVLNNASSEIIYDINEDAEETTDIYSALNLSELGLSHEVFQLALKGHNKLEAEGRLNNPDVLTIVDFSQTSKNKRMYVIDINQQKLLFNTLVAHGRNTGGEYAQHFSNENGTHKSSLGFYVTKNNNMGSSVGFSLIIEGIEKGFNDNAVSRQIILHGANYATEDFINKNGRLGRSFGCPALPPELIKPVVDVIENGSCLFIYYPDSNYLSKSPVLNSTLG
ncbi:MAG TPA: murein L,D-transpeptidase catalytic domain family protein [Brumimicrobium sp.]|nr:murein L,D-transpeptidase catalytic domain family protein [Brumimicrobium sp.]